MRIARRPPRGSASFSPPLGSTLSSVESLRRRLLAALAPVDARDLAPRDAVGAVVARALTVPRDLPAEAIALRRGHAVAAIETIGASPYAPVEPAALRPVEPGEPVAAPFDAVLPFDAVSTVTGAVRVQEAVSPGADLLPSGWCAMVGAPLAAAGSRLTPMIALLAEAAGIDRVASRRPRVLVLHDGSPAGIAAARGLATLVEAGPARAAIATLDTQETAAADLVLLLGRGDLRAADPALAALRDHGRLEGGGLALVGCEAVAWGEIAGRVALILPGRLEELMIATLVLIEPLVRHLAGDGTPPGLAEGRLSRKIVSQVGFTETAFLAWNAAGGLEPLATGRPPWTAIARAEAWIELGPECEGFAEDTVITVRAMPFAPFRPIDAPSGAKT